jgi:hypothetical protein
MVTKQAIFQRETTRRPNFLPVDGRANTVTAPQIISKGHPQDQLNWLRVLGTAELPHIDSGVRHQFHAKVSLLHMFKPQQQPFEFVLPRNGPIAPRPHGMDGGIEEPCASSLGALAVAGIFVDVGDQARIEHARAIVRGIKASGEIEIGSSKV